jgi:hypothetical protein
LAWSAEAAILVRWSPRPVRIAVATVATGRTAAAATTAGTAQKALRLGHFEQWMNIELGWNDLAPLVQQAVQGLHRVDVEQRDRAAADTGVAEPH